MEANNPELQGRLQELEHELEVSCSVSNEETSLLDSCCVRVCVMTRGGTWMDYDLRMLTFYAHRKGTLQKKGMSPSAVI